MGLFDRIPAGITKKTSRKDPRQKARQERLATKLEKAHRYKLVNTLNEVEESKRMDEDYPGARGGKAIHDFAQGKHHIAGWVPFVKIPPPDVIDWTPINRETPKEVLKDVDKLSKKAYEATMQPEIARFNTWRDWLDSLLALIAKHKSETEIRDHLGETLRTYQKAIKEIERITKEQDPVIYQRIQLYEKKVDACDMADIDRFAYWFTVQEREITSAWRSMVLGLSLVEKTFGECETVFVDICRLWEIRNKQEMHKQYGYSYYDLLPGLEGNPFL